VPNSTRSKADYTDQNIGSRNRSKMHNINVNNLSVQNLFFPLHDAILFKEIEISNQKILNKEY
jgi:hypothetical protein